MKKRKLKFDTLQVHAGHTPDPATNSRAVPIYQTTSYTFDNTKHAENLFSLKENGNIYTRIMNPTTDVFEKRMAALEDGEAALAVASGSAAIYYAILNIAGVNDEIVAANTLYGGTHNLFSSTLPQLGINTVFVDPHNTENFRKAINTKTKALYCESIGNPLINIIDIEAIADIAHDNGIPLIVDNTFCTPFLLQPFKYGADIVVHSATKFIGGHGSSIGGIIVDSGNFDWEGSGKFPGLTEPDPSYHGINFVEKFGSSAYITRARVRLLRDTGAALSPFNSFLFLQGLETLSLRIRKHVENTMKIAKFLQQHPYVKSVNYPGLKNNRYYKLAQKYLSKGAGSVLSFRIRGGASTAMKFIDDLNIFSLLANVADAKSLVIHPATTTHQQLSEKELTAAGITGDMIRLSIGIEDAEDLIYDLEQALGKSAEN